MGTRDGRGAGLAGREKQSDDEVEEEDFVIEFFSSNTDKKYECDLTNTDRERERKARLWRTDGRHASSRAIIITYFRDRFTLPKSLFLVKAMTEATWQLELLRNLPRAFLRGHNSHTRKEGGREAGRRE